MVRMALLARLSRCRDRIVQIVRMALLAHQVREVSMRDSAIPIVHVMHATSYLCALQKTHHNEQTQNLLYQPI